MSQKVLKVSVLANYLKQKLDSDFLLQNIIIQGEISNFTNHRSGHWYFTLKDEKSRISCVMFSSSASKVKFLPKEGDKVLVKCNTSIFEPTGQLQLYVTAMKMDGLGDLYLQYEQLKNKLNQEGLFDESNKKSIPKYPKKIGLITGRNTAAREDVIATITRRWPIATISEIPVLVQGEGSSLQLINAINTIDKLDLDVVLIVRGGGSIEDLWSFNSEDLARAIFKMKTPIISGVGHEVDVTIVDYVCDKRAPTPTGATEMATPNIDEVTLNLNNYKTRMISILKTKIEKNKINLTNYKNSYVFTNSLKLYEQKQLQLDIHTKSLMVISSIIDKKQSDLSLITKQFINLLQNTINQNDKRINIARNNMISSTNHIMQKRKENILKNIQLLDAFSPLKVMERGYSLAFKENKLINSVSDIKEDDELKVVLNDGYVITNVRRVNSGK